MYACVPIRLIPRGEPSRTFQAAVFYESVKAKSRCRTSLQRSSCDLTARMHPKHGNFPIAERGIARFDWLCAGGAPTALSGDYMQPLKPNTEKAEEPYSNGVLRDDGIPQNIDFSVGFHQGCDDLFCFVGAYVGHRCADFRNFDAVKMPQRLVARWEGLPYPVGTIVSIATSGAFGSSLV